MTRHDDLLITTVRASGWVLLAAAVVAGLLEVADLLSVSAPEKIDQEAWAPLVALGGLSRVALVAALGIAATAVVLALARRVRRDRPGRPRGTPASRGPGDRRGSATVSGRPDA